MNNSEYEVELHEAEKRLDRLRARYEQYFRGIERREPSIARRDLERRFQVLRKNRPRNTALRFRFQTLKQRYITLRTHWNRISREIENGTYRRDRTRIQFRQRLQQERTAERPAPDRNNDGSVNLDVNVDIDKEVAAALRDADAAAKATPNPSSTRTFAKPTTEPAPSPRGRPRPPPPPPPRAGGRKPPPPPPPRIGEQRLKTIYDEYVSARQQNNERTDSLNYEKLKRQIRQMEPKLNNKYGGKPVDFKVVLKNGRVGLKPVKKES